MMRFCGARHNALGQQHRASAEFISIRSRTGSLAFRPSRLALSPIRLRLLSSIVLLISLVLVVSPHRETRVLPSLTLFHTRGVLSISFAKAMDSSSQCAIAVSVDGNRSSVSQEWLVIIAIMGPGCPRCTGSNPCVRRNQHVSVWACLHRMVLLDTFAVLGPYVLVS